MQGRGGGVGATPPGVSKRKVVELRGKKTEACSQPDLAIGGIFFGPRSIFDLLMTGQSSIFQKNLTFSPFCGAGGKTLKDIDLKPSLSCSLIHSLSFGVYFDTISLIIALRVH